MGEKEILGVVAVLLTFGAYFPYYVGIFRGVLKPHLQTYLIWSILGVIEFSGSWASGGAAGSWSTGVSTLLAISVFLLCFRYGTTDVTRSDTVFSILAALAIIPWFLTKDPTLSIVLATLIEVLAFYPTVRKTWNNPRTESLSSWGINGVKHFVTIFALGSFSLATVFYPVVMLLMDIVMTLEIGLRPKKLKEPSALSAS